MTYLDDDLHKILLCNYVLAVDNLFQYTRKNCPLVHVQIDSVQLAETDEVGPYEDT
jgi:hypothetical protein